MSRAEIFPGACAKRTFARPQTRVWPLLDAGSRPKYHSVQHDYFVEMIMKRVLRKVLPAWFVLVALAVTIGLPSTAVGQSAQERARQVEELSLEAANEYRASNFSRAIELFEEAYAIEPVPNLLFNIAKCHEKLEDWDAAIENYQKFVVEQDTDRKARESALKRIDALQEIKAAEASDDDTKVAAEEPTDSTGPPEKAEVTEGPDHTVAYITLGTGAALLVGGGVFGLMASGKQSDFEDATTAQAKRDARDSGETMALVADVMYAAGAVTAGVGLYLLLTADSESPAQASVAFPWVGESSAGVGVRTTF